MRLHKHLLKSPFGKAALAAVVLQWIFALCRRAQRQGE